MDTKLTVRVPRHLIENAKRYAKENNTSLTDLITAYLKQIPGESDIMNRAPLVRQMSGLISAGVSPGDYKKHLEEKYGRE